MGLPTGTAIDYVVDGRQRRIGKRVNGTLVQAFLYQDQLRPVTEIDGTGAVVARFVYGAAPNVPAFVIQNGITHRIIADHLGSPRLVVNASDGTVVQRTDYDEFGTVLADVVAPEFRRLPFGFAGGLYDQLGGDSCCGIGGIDVGFLWVHSICVGRVTRH